MEIFRNGKFSHMISGDQLSRGLRYSKRLPRNNNMMTECSGAIGRDNILHIIEEFNRINTNAITDSFPYPQLFVLNEVIVVCSSTTLYEWFNGALVTKFTATSEQVGHTWKVADYHSTLYLSNGKITVVKDPKLKTYSVSTYPIATGICNYNGQLIIGAPDVEVTSNG